MNLTDRVVAGASQVVVKAVKAAWPLVGVLNRAWHRPALHPAWAPAPLIKSTERTYPQLGWPRQTDSLCPRCVKEVREDILSGRRELSELTHGKPGEIRANILERDGQILMEKECPKHGVISDVMAIDPKFLGRIEKLYPGRDFRTEDTPLRFHGTSKIQYGRGAVLTVDLTNRCNMMCDPCFMDANQVGFVHELSWDEIKKILDRQHHGQAAPADEHPVLGRRADDVAALPGRDSLRPRGRLLRGAGRDQRPALCPRAGFCQAGQRSRPAHGVYLQFDGIGNEANSHRKIGNLFDVKLRAIEELHAAGIDVILVVTVINTVNNDQIGKILRFAIENSDKITVVSFQPVSFTGRDEDISDELRQKQRYTLSHLARDVQSQTGVTEPLRDWFPLVSALGPFSNLTDMLLGPEAQFGAVNCGCHPNCGIGTILFVNKETKIR